MANGSRSEDSGATGRPTLTSLIEKATGTLMRTEQPRNMAPPTRPAVQVNGLPAVSDLSTPITPAQERDAVKLNMLRRIRPPPFKYAWAFYHDKHSPSADYEGRLTMMLDNIITIKTFWEVFNQFPLDALKMKDSVHFFKRGVKPVWEDPRNITGGSWTFRVPKAQSGEFWKETLLLAVGEQFVDVIQPRKFWSPESSIHRLEATDLLTGDDLCGVSLSVRFNSNLITIWNRDASNQKSIDGILSVVLDEISPELKPKEGSWYYKKHSEHAAFNEVVTKAKSARLAKEAAESKAKDDGKIIEAEVKEDEGDYALLKEAEGVEIEDLVKQ